MSFMEPAKDQFHETNRYEDPDFPVGLFIVTREGIRPEGRGHMDLHWHEELQLTLVTHGSVDIQVQDRAVRLHAGQGIFINKNRLHITRDLTEDGRYVSVNFPEKLLGFYPGSRMEQEDVRPYTGNVLFSSLVFTGEEEWHSRVTGGIRRLSEWLEERPVRFQYRTAVELAGIWHEIIDHVPDLPAMSPSQVRKQERMRQMLNFIHENYSGNVLLKDIAGAAGVSEGECGRCFRETILESPVQYLIRYRIDQAKELLTLSERSVTEIGLDCGFSDASQFIRHFRKRTGMTPSEYRKN